MTASARYDAVADFYVAGWTDDLDDPVSQCLLDMIGAVRGRRVLEVGCGHGRIARGLTRQGAQVTGCDLSAALLARAEALEHAEPLGICYLHADVAAPGLLEGEVFDLAVSSFSLSDIDDLDGALANVSRLVRPRGRFVFSILHPCFPGGPGVSGSWPSDGSYHDEHWWRADGSLSSLRRQVGANHRKLSTYLNAMHRHGLVLDTVAEPPPPTEWSESRQEAARFPVFLVAGCHVCG